MSTPNPQVSVFHFTSRISSAKIRKYKMATERGMLSSMASHQTVQDARHIPTHPGPIPPPTATRCASTESPRPLKKRRLILKPPRPLVSSGDVASGSQLGQGPTVQFQYSRDMAADDDGVIDPEAQLTSEFPPKVKAYENVPSSASGEQDASHGDVRPSHPVREGYGDFMSYYITKGDSDNPTHPKPEPQAVSKSRPKLKLKKQVLVHPSPKRKGSSKSKQPMAALKCSSVSMHANSIVPKPTSIANSSSSVFPTHNGSLEPLQGMPGNPLPTKASPRCGSLPQLVFQWVDIVFDPKPSKKNTIAEMVAKVQRLSTALADFGGIAAVPNISTSTQAGRDEARAAEDQPPSTADERDDETMKQDSVTFIGHDGAPDISLNHGILFIMNALKSWAQQRLAAENLQKVQAETQKRASPAEPRVGSPHSNVSMVSTDEIITVCCDLADTPEGVAIKAFQDVLECGCLQMNVTLPVQLSRALAHLYTQIDQLINSGQNEQGKWQCMSYGAQILAHQERLNRWKEERRTIQAETLQQLQHAEFQKLARASFGSNRSRYVDTPIIASLDRHRGGMGWQHMDGIQSDAQFRRKAVSSSIRTSAPSPSSHLTFSPVPWGPHHALQTDGIAGDQPSQADGGYQRNINPPASVVNHDLRTGHLPRSGQSMASSFSPTIGVLSNRANGLVDPCSHTRSQGPKWLKNKSLTRQSMPTQARPGDSTERPMEIQSSDPSSPKPWREASKSTPRSSRSRVEEKYSPEQLGNGHQIFHELATGTIEPTKDFDGKSKLELVSPLPPSPSDVFADRISSPSRPIIGMPKGPSPSASSSQGSTIAVAVARPPSPVRSIKLRPTRRSSRKSGAK